MTSTAGVPESLRDLLKCNVCLEEVTNQKALPCQHTICLLCLKQLTISTKHKIKCPVCSKAHNVPNGGVENFDRSLVTRQLADLLKAEAQISAANKSDESVVPSDDEKPLSPRERRQQQISIKKALDSEIERTNSWMRETTAALKDYTEVMGAVDSGVSATKEIIQLFLAEINRQGQAKLKSLLEAHELYKNDIGPLKQGANKSVQLAKSSLAEGKSLTGKLKSGNATDIELKKAEECVETLKQNRQVEYENIKKVLSRGDSVRISVLCYLDNPKELMANKVPYTSVGTFQGVIEDKFFLPGTMFPMPRRRARVIFPEKLDWTGPTGMLVKSSTPSICPKLEDRVRVKASITKPSAQWNGVRPGKSKGILKELDFGGPEDDVKVVVDFPECPKWRGLYSEIEKIPGCGYMVGDLVRVSRDKEEPSMGWAGVNGSSIGKITSITKPAQGEGQEEQVTVEFEECKEWRGVVSDIEISRRPTIGDVVQLKLTVKKPKLGWDGVTHSDIGRLVNIMHDDDMGAVGRVRLKKLGNRTWDCLLNELEYARYAKDQDYCDSVGMEENRNSEPLDNWDENPSEGNSEIREKTAFGPNSEQCKCTFRVD